MRPKALAGSTKNGAQKHLSRVNPESHRELEVWTSISITKF